MQIQCSQCGAAFTCGAGTGSCWCMDLPRITPIPRDGQGGCLCQKCLKMKQGLITLPGAGHETDAGTDQDPESQ